MTTSTAMEVTEALEAEIESIKTDTGSIETVAYAPKAWTREGRVD